MVLCTQNASGCNLGRERKSNTLEVVELWVCLKEEQ